MLVRRLLLIEDEPALQTLLYDVLSDAGYAVSVAMPDDYLYMMHEVQPSVLVLGCDNRGTFERGWEIAATLRQDFPQLVMVLLSTNSKIVEEVGQTARGRMFAAGVQKPFLLDDLVRTIDGCGRAPRDSRSGPARQGEPDQQR